MQGPSEFGIVGNASLKNWNRKPDLNKIKVPVLSIGGEFDTMDPKAMEEIAKLVMETCEARLCLPLHAKELSEALKKSTINA